MRDLLRSRRRIATLVGGGGLSRAAALVVLLVASACQREPMDRTSQEAKSAMLTSLASRFRVDPLMIESSSFRQMIWQDDCYGIQQDRACNPGSFFGYQLAVIVGDQSYVYNA